MIYYTYFLLVLLLVGSLIPGDIPNTQSNRVASFIWLAPLLGRILGWW